MNSGIDNESNKLVIGIDFGTSSVRALLVDAHTGVEIAVSEFEYPRWKQGLFCDPARNQFRQHPLDYIEGLENVIKDVKKKSEKSIQIDWIKAISIDTTGSTPVAVNEQGIPLSLLPGFENNPNAMFFLWKDHSAVQEALEINKHAKKFRINYLQYVGGIYSSEWFWAKLLYALRVDEDIKTHCYSWVEHCDWIPFMLTGGESADYIKRSVCAAGHKALWAEEFGGFPPDDFFVKLDPLLGSHSRRISNETFSANEPAGKLSDEWAKKLGLSTKVIIGIGALDAHMGAVGSQIQPYYLSKIMGTSTCDMLITPGNNLKNKLVRGICGQVNGSIIPGMLGLEAGQSAFGDIYEWFGKLILWPIENLLPDLKMVDNNTADCIKLEFRKEILKKLNEEAAKVELSENLELSVDWLNGRRSPDANQLLKGAIFNLNLGSDTVLVYRSLVEATCFGSRSIIERFAEEGIPIKGVISVGGVAKKSSFVMQMMADVLGLPIKVHKSSQTCASGATMFAATVAGIYSNLEDAMEKLGQGFEKEYHPDMQKHEIYNNRFERYKILAKFIEEKSIAIS